MVALSPLFSSLLSLAVLSAANPIVRIRSNGITVNVATHIKATGSSQFVKDEQFRAQALIQRGNAKAAFAAGVAVDDGTSIPVTNTAVSYTMNITVGNPPTGYTLLVDTGSSNTWVGAGKNYTRTSSSKDTGDTVSVTYGSGNFSGIEVIDTVDLGRGLVIPNQSIGVATQSQGFNDIDGILGIGPVDLTRKTLSSDKDIPTVTDNLANAGTIPANSIGVFFAPTTSQSDTNGELTFGGIDSSKITGDVTFVPITSTPPASEFWGINQTITYGSNRTSVLDSAGIVDTGTTLMLLASDAFEIYTQAVGASLDQATGLLKVADPSTLESLFYKIGNTTFEFTAEAQEWPKNFNTLIGGDSNSTYLVVADMGQTSGQGLDFINGYTWLEHFYSVFDTDNRQVGIAKTSNQDSTSLLPLLCDTGIICIE